MPDGLCITLQAREELERIVVRLVQIAGRSEDIAMQRDLMELSDDLVTIIDGITE
jgi:hypothetical protein